jgi:hypothetical protein
MSKDPWTDPDPQPGDLDAELALLDESAFEYRDGDPSATMRIVFSLEGENARRLARVADARGQSPSDVVAELVQTPIARRRSASFPNSGCSPRGSGRQRGRERSEPPAAGLLRPMAAALMS